MARHNDRETYGLLTELDPAFYLFVVCLVAVLASLGYAGRIVTRARRERYRATRLPATIRKAP